MPFSDDSTAVLMFKREILAVFNRWAEESDLNIMQMTEAAVEIINLACGEQAIDFEPDQDFIDKIDDNEE